MPAERRQGLCCMHWNRHALFVLVENFAIRVQNIGGDDKLGPD